MSFPLITKAQLTKTWWPMKHACVNLPLIRINSILKTQRESPMDHPPGPRRWLADRIVASMSRLQNNTAILLGCCCLYLHQQTFACKLYSAHLTFTPSALQPHVYCSPRTSTCSTIITDIKSQQRTEFRISHTVSKIFKEGAK